MCAFCPWSPLSHGCMRRYGSLLLWFNLFQGLCRDRLSLNIPWRTEQKNGSGMQTTLQCMKNNQNKTKTQFKLEIMYTQTQTHTDTFILPQCSPLWSPLGCGSPLLSDWTLFFGSPYACCSTTALSNNPLLPCFRSGPTPQKSGPA